jgi:3-oxoacyl-[acyl-carrier-protein] synthase II
MRRVVVTGLGAVTSLGHDAPSTWEGAVAGRSGVDWIRSFDAGGFPVRIASEVKGFDPVDVVGPKDARRLERNVVLAVAAAREAWSDAGSEGVDPARAGILVRRSPPARRGRTRWGREPSSFAAATPTSSSRAARRPACIR